MQVNATKVQKRMRRPRTAAQKAADVVEHVISVEGEDYLETAQHQYSWWQLSMIDVYATLLVAVAIITVLVGSLAWLLLRSCWQASRRLWSSKKKMS